MISNCSSKDSLVPTALDWYHSKSDIFYRSFLDATPDLNGRVAYGGKLTTEMLLEAYARGIFPWYENTPVEWYSPFWRSVFFLNQFKISKSFSKFLKKHKYQINFDTQFKEVIENCANIYRKGQSGATWITKEMKKAYFELHQIGVAHSVEIKNLDKTPPKLVGGLYGISLGKAFFGESMFSLESNTSKLALYTLFHFLKKKNFHLIDCQLPTDHLESLGAERIDRLTFLKCLEESNRFATSPEKWRMKQNF